jgi:hypothetical protein
VISGGHACPRCLTGLDVSHCGARRRQRQDARIVFSRYPDIAAAKLRCVDFVGRGVEEMPLPDQEVYA